MLEAVKPEGYVVSVEDRVVFIPRESVLQLELYNPDDLEIDDLELARIGSDDGPEWKADTG
jgi:hypothetical protein